MVGSMGLVWIVGFSYMIITYILEITIVWRLPKLSAKIIYTRPFTYAGLLLLTPIILALSIQDLITKAIVLCVICMILLTCLLGKRTRVRYFISLLTDNQMFNK